VDALREKTINILLECEAIHADISIEEIISLFTDITIPIESEEPRITPDSDNEEVWVDYQQELVTVYQKVMDFSKNSRTIAAYDVSLPPLPDVPEFNPFHFPDDDDTMSMEDW